MPLIPDPRFPGKHIDTTTGIWPLSEWGSACARGFVRDERFGSGQVIKATSRETSRKWRKLDEHKQAECL